MVMAENNIDEADFVATVKAMVSDGSLALQEPPYDVQTALDYLFTLTLSGWLWLTLGATALALLATTLIPDIFPLNSVRWVLGSIFVMYLPGHTGIHHSSTSVWLGQSLKFSRPAVAVAM